MQSTEVHGKNSINGDGHKHARVSNRGQRSSCTQLIDASTKNAKPITARPGKGSVLETACSRKKIIELRNAEAVKSVEFLLRLAVVIGTAAVGWLVLGAEALPYWVAIYYALVTVEKSILKFGEPRNSNIQFGALLVVSFLIGSVFAWLPIYLWNRGADIWQMGAMAAMIGGVLNVFLLRSRTWEIGVAYLVPICAAFFVISFDFFEGPYGGAKFWSATLLASCVSIYFGISIWEAHRRNRELDSARRQFAIVQKNEAIGTLTAGIAHDFNNLLSAARGNLELLEIDPSSKFRDTYIQEALSAIQRGATLTKQLTQYARGQPHDVKELDPEKIIDEIAALTKRVIPSNIISEFTVDADHHRVLADEAMLQSALLNLVVNARDAMPDGGSMLIGFTSKPAEIPPKLAGISGKYAEFFVRDTGTGIPKETQDRIFDPFYTTKDQGKGSGLGLAMVLGFAQQSGGEVSLESSVGKGTTVSLFLPKS